MKARWVTAAATAVALVLLTGLAPAQAAAPQMGAGFAPFHRAKLGAFEITTILAGSRAGSLEHGLPLQHAPPKQSVQHDSRIAGSPVNKAIWRTGCV